MSARILNFIVLASLVGPATASAQRVELNPTSVAILSAGAATSKVGFRAANVEGQDVLTADRAGAVLGLTAIAAARQDYGLALQFTTPTEAQILVRANGGEVGRIHLPAGSGVRWSDSIVLKFTKGGNAFSLTVESGAPFSLAAIRLVSTNAPTAPPPIAQPTVPPVVEPTPRPTLKSPGAEVFNLTFEDRFRETQLDSSKWRPFGSDFPTFGPAHCVAGTSGCPKSEVTWIGKVLDVSGVFNNLYSPANVELTGSSVILRAENKPINYPKVNAGPQALSTSGWIDTYGLFSQTYGFFEMRAKMPAGNGFWPAFWLMPQNRQWSHEIDIFEILTGNNGADRANTGPNSVHVGLLWDRASGSSGKWFKDKNLDVTTDFHTYGLLWKPDALTFFVDGQSVHVVKAADKAKIPQIPMYIIANLALGGSWGGNPDVQTDFSRGMEITYVRAFQYEGAPVVKGDAAFPVVVDKVSPTMAKARAGSTLPFDIAVNSLTASNAAFSLNYTLSSVINDPGALVKGRDRVSGTLKGLELKAGAQAFRVNAALPADLPVGIYYLRARVLDAKTGGYSNGGTVAVVEVQ